MTRRLDQLVTGLTGTALTALLLVGPPWLLTTYVGPPIPSSWPDLDTLRTITTIGVTDTFVITTLAVIVWIAWAQLAAAIVTEVRFGQRPPRDALTRNDRACLRLACRRTCLLEVAGLVVVERGCSCGDGQLERGSDGDRARLQDGD